MKLRCKNCGVTLPVNALGIAHGFHYCESLGEHKFNDSVSEPADNPAGANLTVNRLLELKESLTTVFYVHDEETHDKVKTFLLEARFPGFFKIHVNSLVEPGKIIKVDPPAFRSDS